MKFTELNTKAQLQAMTDYINGWYETRQYADDVSMLNLYKVLCDLDDNYDMYGNLIIEE